MTYSNADMRDGGLVEPSTLPVGAFWTASEMARQLHFSEPAMRNLLKRPGFPKPCLKVGRRIYWNSLDISRWQDELTRTANETGAPVDMDQAVEA